jgi:RHS repeat-associated protein
MQMVGRNGSTGDYRYGFQGSEMDNEIRGVGNSYTTSFRQLDVRLARWLSIDPVVKSHESPCAWNTNNPISYIDITGSDSTQRAQAVAKAKEYKEGSTGTSASYVLGDKGAPDSPVDCSGLVSACIVAGGEVDPVLGNKDAAIALADKSNGVTRIAAGTTEVEINNIVGGSVITFNNWSHTGLVSGGIVRDESGEVTKFQVIHSGSSTGPTEITINLDGNGYWDDKYEKFYKWDTKPDGVSTSVSADISGFGGSLSKVTPQMIAAYRSTTDQASPLLGMITAGMTAQANNIITLQNVSNNVPRNNMQPMQTIGAGPVYTSDMIDLMLDGNSERARTH